MGHGPVVAASPGPGARSSDLRHLAPSPSAWRVHRFDRCWHSERCFEVCRPDGRTGPRSKHDGAHEQHLRRFADRRDGRARGGASRILATSKSLQKYPAADFEGLAFRLNYFGDVFSRSPAFLLARWLLPGVPAERDHRHLDGGRKILRGRRSRMGGLSPHGLGCHGSVERRGKPPATDRLLPRLETLGEVRIAPTQRSLGRPRQGVRHLLVCDVDLADGYDVDHRHGHADRGGLRLRIGSVLWRRNHAQQHAHSPPGSDPHVTAPGRSESEREKFTGTHGGCTAEDHPLRYRDPHFAHTSVNVRNERLPSHLGGRSLRTEDHTFCRTARYRSVHPSPDGSLCSRGIQRRPATKDARITDRRSNRKCLSQSYSCSEAGGRRGRDRHHRRLHRRGRTALHEQHA